MRLTIKTFTVIATLLLVASTALPAQNAGRRARLLGIGPDSARRERVRQRLANLTPAQQQALRARRQAARTERLAVRARVQSGQITRKQAHRELRTWRKANRPKVLAGSND